jgi:thioester reductase-like protein
LDREEHEELLGGREMKVVAKIREERDTGAREWLTDAAEVGGDQRFVFGWSNTSEHVSVTVSEAESDGEQ